MTECLTRITQLSENTKTARKNLLYSSKESKRINFYVMVLWDNWFGCPPAAFLALFEIGNANILGPGPKVS